MKAGALPHQWEQTTLADLISDDGLFADGDWIESKDQDPNGGVRLVQLADIGDGVFRNRSNRFLTMERAKALGCTFLEPGDLLVARMPDPLGRACIFPGDSKPCITAVDVSIVRPRSPNVDSKLLMHFLNSSPVRGRIASMQSGSTRKRISRMNLSTVELPLPPIPDQRRIVAKIEELFTQVDAGVQALERAKTLLKQYRQSLLKSAFSGKLTEKWREENRDRIEPASVLLERIREERKKKLGKKYKELPPLDTSNLPELPEGWAWARLGDILAEPLTNGKSPSTKAGGILILRLSAVKADGLLDFSETKEGNLRPDDAVNLFVREQDMFITRGNGSIRLVGRAGLAINVTKQIVFSDKFVRVRPVSDVDVLFLHLLWNSAWVRNQIEGRAKTTAGIHMVTHHDMESIVLPIPSRAEQQLVSMMFNTVNTGLGRLDDEVAAADVKQQALRQSILHCAFSGELIGKQQ